MSEHFVSRSCWIEEEKLRILSTKQLTYHWFAVKVEALFTPKSVGCSGCLLEHNPRLPTQLQSLFRYDIDDFSILRKDHVEHLF